MKQVYLDLDGVCADFDARKLEVFGRFDVDDKVMWKIIHEEFPNWFRELKPMDDLELLWNYLKKYNPIILTACSRSNIYQAVRQKMDWVSEYLHPNPPVIVCMRSHKKDYANSDAILIDDHEDNVQQFVRHGGTGVLHTSAAMSIARLIDML